MNQTQFGDATVLKHLKLTRPLAVLDTETTGLVEDDGRIVELAIVRVYPKGDIVAHSWRIDPGTEIPADASRIHGITTADVEGCPPFVRVADRARAMLDETDWCGYNLLRFDLPILDAEQTRCGLYPVARGHRSIIDVMDLFWRFLPLGFRCRPAKGTGGLDACCSRYLGGGIPGAHGALRDALATLWCLDAMIAREGLPDTVAGLAELLAQPVRLPDVAPGPIRQPALIPGLDAPERDWGPYRGL